MNAKVAIETHAIEVLAMSVLEIFDVQEQLQIVFRTTHKSRNIEPLIFLHA